MTPAVVAVVATYRRPFELGRLIDSVATLRHPLAAFIVVDNSSNAEIRALVEKAPFRAIYLDPGKNLGCGGGLRLAEEHALSLPDVTATHVLVLDDDAVLTPDCVDLLVAASAEEKADLAYPMVLDGDGHVNWLPGIPVHREYRRMGMLDREKFIAHFGDRPRTFVNAQGVCLLISRAALEAKGLHRDDFWVRGEDIEFTLRFTRHHRGIFVPSALAHHLPPPEHSVSSTRAAEYLKHCAMVQNNSYLGIRLPHGWRIAWTTAGTLRHFFSIWGFRALPDALRAMWRGAVLGEPAGVGSGRTFYARFVELMAASK